MFRIIRQSIIDLINSPSVKHIQVAYRTDRSQVDGYPAALVIPTESQAEYHQTSPESNKETYLFTIRIIVPITDKGQDAADMKLELAVDELIAILRDRKALKDGDGNPVVDWLAPVPSSWGYQDREVGQCRIAQLNLQATKYIDPSSS